MTNDKTDQTRYELIKLELQGKDQAVGGYDEILWKIRAGYSAVLYGSLSLISGLGGNGEPWFPNAPVIAWLLIVGFTVCALALDLGFLRRKLRVVQARDELIALAWKVAGGTVLEGCEKKRLEELLRNAGETDTPVIWTRRNARLSVAILYGTTAIVGSLAILLMVRS